MRIEPQDDKEILAKAVEIATKHGCDYVQSYGPEGSTAWLPDGSKGWRVVRNRSDNSKIVVLPVDADGVASDEDLLAAR